MVMVADGRKEGLGHGGTSRWMMHMGNDDDMDIARGGND